MNAATIDGGVIQPTTRQSTRPARACVAPAVRAADALTAMFVPAAVAGGDAATRTAGRRRLPRTRPIAPPTIAVANDAAPARTSSQASRAPRRPRPTPGPG